DEQRFVVEGEDEGVGDLPDIDAQRGSRQRSGRHRIVQPDDLGVQVVLGEGGDDPVDGGVGGAAHRVSFGSVIASSRCAHSSSGLRSCATSSIEACRSPSRTKRSGTVAIVQSCGSTSATSAQVIGVDTVPSGFPRTEYAAAIVWSRAFWL